MTKVEPRTGDIGAEPLDVEIREVIRAAQSKRAADVVVLDLRKAAAFTDFFVLCSGQNARQIRTITDAVEQALRRIDVRPSHIEGYERADWVLVDCFDFVVHIFTPETRLFYALERLWGSADRIDVADDAR